MKMLKFLLIACFLSVTLDALFVQGQWWRSGVGNDLKVIPISAKPNDKFKFMPITVKPHWFTTSKPQWSVAYQHYGKWNGNAQVIRDDFNLFGVSLVDGKPRISNIGYGHEFPNGVRIHGGATLSQDKFLGRIVGGNIGMKIPLKRDLERQKQQEEQDISNRF